MGTAKETDAVTELRAAQGLLCAQSMSLVSWKGGRDGPQRAEGGKAGPQRVHMGVSYQVMCGELGTLPLVFQALLENAARGLTCSVVRELVDDELGSLVGEADGAAPSAATREALDAEEARIEKSFVSTARAERAPLGGPELSQCDAANARLGCGLPLAGLDVTELGLGRRAALQPEAEGGDPVLVTRPALDACTRWSGKQSRTWP